MIAGMAPAQPKYTRIAADLRLRIATGELRVGDRVPPESVLTEQYGVSKMTAARALEQLVAEGLIVRRSGSGSFVTAVPETRVVHVRKGSRITARGGDVTLIVEQPGTAPEQYRAETTIIIVQDARPPP
jgi:DNA-binding GntR family transcriptional regulator